MDVRRGGRAQCAHGGRARRARRGPRRRGADADRQPIRVGLRDGRVFPVGRGRTALQRAAAGQGPARAPRGRRAGARARGRAQPGRARGRGPDRRDRGRARRGPAGGRAGSAGGAFPRRPVPDRVHERDRGRAQGGGARAALPRRAAHAGRALARAGGRRARVVHGGQRLVEVGAQCLHRALAAGRRGAAARRALRARGAAGRPGARAREPALHGADRVPRDRQARAAAGPPGAHRPGRRRGGAQPRGPAGLGGGDRPRHPRRLRADGDRSAHRQPARRARRAPARWACRCRASTCGWTTASWCCRPGHRPHLLPRLRRRVRLPPRRRVADGRPGPGGRRRLPVLRGTHRRRDHLGRIPDRAVRGRVGAGGAPGGGRGGRRRGARRRARGVVRAVVVVREGYAPPGSSRPSCRTTSGARPRPTSTHGSSSSPTSCRRPRAARCAARCCASAVRPAARGRPPAPAKVRRRSP